MNSLASISLIVLLLIKGLAPGMDLTCDLRKCPNLQAHNEAHSLCGKGFIFPFSGADVLTSHTSPESHGDKGHDKLPFQESDRCCHPSVYYAADQAFTLASFEFIPQVEFGYYKPLHPYEFLDSPFQPPQV